MTHPGRVRPTNEDSLLWDLDGSVFIVADGMGGHQAGEVASQLAIDSIRTFLDSSRADRDLTWPYGYDPARSLNANRLATAVKLANRRVFRAGEEQRDYAGMGTTIVAAIIEDDTLTFCGVGDSRLYLMERGAMAQLTHDDSWVASVLAADPGADRESLAHHPMRHVLTNVVGARDETDVEVGERPFVPGQILLLCSDGLYGALGDRDIERILSGAGRLEELAERLIAAALDRDASDNVTALLVRRES